MLPDFSLIVFDDFLQHVAGPFEFSPAPATPLHPVPSSILCREFPAVLCLSFRQFSPSLSFILSPVDRAVWPARASGQPIRPSASLRTARRPGSPCRLQQAARESDRRCWVRDQHRRHPASGRAIQWRTLCYTCASLRECLRGNFAHAEAHACALLCMGLPADSHGQCGVDPRGAWGPRLLGLIHHPAEPWAWGWKRWKRLTA